MFHRLLRQANGAALISRFWRNRDGATAVEFALIGLPLFALLFAIIQTSILIFATHSLQSMVDGVSRKMMTGQLASASETEFRNTLCDPDTSGLFDCGKMRVQVQSFPNFSTADPSTFMNKACFHADPDEDTPCYNPGASQQVTLIRVHYDWPFGANMADLGKHTLVAVSAFRNEPY